MCIDVQKYVYLLIGLCEAYCLSVKNPSISTMHVARCSTYYCIEYSLLFTIHASNVLNVLILCTPSLDNLCFYMQYFMGCHLCQNSLFINLCSDAGIYTRHLLVFMTITCILVFMLHAGIYASCWCLRFMLVFTMHAGICDASCAVYSYMALMQHVHVCGAKIFGLQETFAIFKHQR